MGAATIGAAVLAPGAEADTFTVSNLDNAGPGSLRRAVLQANTNPGLDQVVFQSTLSGDVTLNSAIAVTDGVGIAGPGAQQVTLDAEGSDRILSLYGMPANNRGVAIADLTLEDGYADYGGAIYSAEAALQITRSTITGNSATAAGGGIYSLDSSLSLVDTRVLDNSTDGYGGGVYAAGSTVAITRSRMNGNAAAAAGGAVYASNSALSLAEARVDSNSSEGYGGGVYAGGSTVDIADSKFAYNTADSSGGGIAAANSPLSMRRTSVGGNESLGYGGGVYVYGDPAAGSASVEIADSSLFSNYARSDGGAAYLGASGAVTVARTTISGNDANRSGGGLAVGYGANAAPVTISDSTLSGNRAVRRDGGGVLIAGPTGQTLLQNVTISGNVAGRSGGGASVYNAYDTPVTVRNSTVVGNEAGSLLYGGGGIYQYGGDCVVDPAPLRPPRAACAGGKAGDTMVLSSTIVADNAAAADPDLGGGGGGYSYFQAGFNLIGERPYLATMTGDPAGSNIVGEDPSLGPLYDNGGATYTHEPYGDSPALDAGIANGLAQDQRGSQRTVHLPGVRTAGGSDNTDVGSVEAAACLSAVATPVSNKLKLRGAKVDKKRGSAKLAVKVPFSGKLKLKKTSEVVGQGKQPKEAGKLNLLVKARGRALKKLNETGKTQVTAKVRFAPDCGRPKTKSKTITLLKR